MVPFGRSTRRASTSAISGDAGQDDAQPFGGQVVANELAALCRRLPAPLGVFGVKELELAAAGGGLDGRIDLVHRRLGARQHGRVRRQPDR